MIRHNTNVRKNQKRTALQTKSNNNKNSAVVDDYDDDDHVNIKATVALELLDLLKSGDVELATSSSSSLSQRYKLPPQIEAFLKERKEDVKTVNCRGNTKKFEQTTKRRRKRGGGGGNHHSHKKKNKDHDNVKSVQRQQSELKKSLTSLESLLEVELVDGDETSRGKNKKLKDQSRLFNGNEDVNGSNNDSSLSDVYDPHNSISSVDDFDVDSNLNDFDDESYKFWPKTKNKKGTGTNNNEDKNNNKDTNIERLLRVRSIHKTIASSRIENCNNKNSIFHDSIQSAPAIMLLDDNVDDKRNDNSSRRRRRKNSDTCSNRNRNCMVESKSGLKKVTTDVKDIAVQEKNQIAKLTRYVIILAKRTDDKIAQLEKNSNEKYDTLIQMVKGLYAAQDVPLPKDTIETDNTDIGINDIELVTENSISSVTGLPRSNLREYSQGDNNNKDGEDELMHTRGASRRKQDFPTSKNEKGKKNSTSSTMKL